MNKCEFVERVEACEGRLYRVALTILGSAADAEDAVQDALLSAWRALGSLREERYFETWLMRILINACRSELRARSRRAAVDYDALPEAPLPPPPEPQLFEALEQLAVKYRLPLMLHCAEGYSVAEVADMLRLPVGAVKWRIGQARRELASIMEKERA
ncbi:MAG: RNA polymerase sigma factor [Candidatus Fimadaptatus sp.]